MIILSHPTGNQNVRAALNGFQDANMLSEFYTSIASFENDLLDTIGGFGPLKEIRRRRFAPSLKSLTKTFPYKEAGRLLFRKAGFNKLVRHEEGSFSVDAVYNFIDKKTATRIKSDYKNIFAVYAYEDGALSSFRAAAKSGIQRLYDLPIGYWKSARKILANEKDKWPDWAETLTGFQDSPDKLAKKDDELRLADRIFVASSFTAQTLKEFEGALAPVEIIPYGFPAIVDKRIYNSPAGRRLKVLFVGGLSQRKGIANLFSAMAKFANHAELTIVGKPASGNCTALKTALARHKWIPALSHEDILKLMQEYDILVFPSLFEGFGLVITEAMSQGTPVITTYNTAGPEFITNRENGLLIEAGSTEALENAIEEILLNPSIIKKMGHAAIETAALRPWSVYGNELAIAVAKTLTV